jgi:hypothetical protein
VRSAGRSQCLSPTLCHAYPESSTRREGPLFAKQPAAKTTCAVRRGHLVTLQLAPQRQLRRNATDAWGAESDITDNGNSQPVGMHDVLQSAAFVTRQAGMLPRLAQTVASISTDTVLLFFYSAISLPDNVLPVAVTGACAIGVDTDVEEDHRNSKHNYQCRCKCNEYSCCVKALYGVAQATTWLEVSSHSSTNLPRCVNGLDSVYEIGAIP